ncbi:TetR/AcrR family transcriptional regulator [Streptomyces sp. ISL-11]|uniref:TetR/AcrR family transcriptional regulator n=1 Tax=Streptomyces sp. ISL-11 TaxID=2819174 RepID=UPI001BECFC37|nr:TetR/AcrR family transcriptional regulator [Streptomyces sp. ISL-11]MBT2384337.1 TetR/AcrR family transcriptional regulator C-terminal domain-containing protein [Streptomyces sp. ISL-11]
MPAQDKQDKSENKGQVSLWERLERPAPAPRSTLTPRRIAAAAVELADAEGIDAVTMRRLATELGVAPMAAYRYVSGKEELLELMADFVYGELTLPDDTAGWRDTMRTLALRIRTLILRHPWMARSAVFTLTPNQLAVPERTLTKLSGLGLDADTMMTAVRTVTAYARGAVDAEIGLLRLMRERGWSDGHETRSGLAPQMRWLMNTGRYPAFLRYLGEATRKDDAQWQFEAGLDCVLDGIAARMGI